MRCRGEQREERSSFGLGLKLAAVVLIVAAAGGGYWYWNRGASVSANGNAAVQPETVANPETDSGAISSKPANNSLNTPPATAAADRNLPSLHPSGLKESNSALPAGKSGNPSGSIENPAPVGAGVVQPEAVPAKKPTIGELHLAAPAVRHPNAVRQNS